MAADPRSDPRARDLLAADVGVVGELVSAFRTVAQQAQTTADGLRGAAGDAEWTGAAASAFRAGVGKLPGDLGKVTSSYQEAGDALSAYDGELGALKPSFQSVVSELGSADAQLASAQSSLSSAQSALGAAQAKLTASAVTHPLAPLRSVPVSSPLVSAVSAASSAVGNAQGEIDALSARGFRILDEFDSARGAAKGRIATASQVPPQPSFWDTVFGDVGNFLGGALHFVEGIGAGIWNSVTGTVGALENFVNHPSLETFAHLASDVAVDASIVVLASSAPEALGLLGAAEGGIGGIAPVLQGAAGVDRTVTEIEAAGGRVLGREVTVEAGGVRTRPDLFAELPNGQRAFVEVKTGDSADLTSNQRAAFPLLRTQGGVAVGKNAAAAGLEPGAVFGPMPVWVVRQPWPLP